MDNREKYEPIAREAARANNVDECVIIGIITRESTWNPQARNGTSIGIAQINPAFHDVNPHDPVASIWYLAKLMRSYLDRYRGRTDLALAAYNWGSTNLDENHWIIPDSVQWNYVRPVLRDASNCFVTASEPTPEPTAESTVVSTQVLSTPTATLTALPTISQGNPVAVATAQPTPGIITVTAMTQSAATPTPPALFDPIFAASLVAFLMVTRLSRIWP